MIAPALVSLVLAAGSLDEQIHQKRVEQLELARGITDAGPDVHFRVAELWWEEARYFLLKQDPAASERASKQAVAACQQLFEKFPAYARMDEVLASMGLALLDLGDDPRAVIALKRLVERYPASPRAGEAWFRIGEHLLARAEGRRDWVQRARAAFAKSDLGPEARFKEAWCAMNLNDFEAALDGFEAVAKAGAMRSKEARQAYLLTWVRSGGKPTAARAALARLASGADDRRALEAQLAERYHTDGFDRDAAVVWQALVSERPTAPEAFAYQTALVDAVMRLGNKELTVQQVNRLVALSGTLPVEVERGGAAPLLASLATTWHRECRKTREEACLRFPAAVYDAYLALYPSGAQAYELRFYFAELLFETNDFARAAAQYRAVVERDAACKTSGGCRPGKFFEAAAFGEIKAREALALLDGSEHGETHQHARVLYAAR